MTLRRATLYAGGASLLIAWFSSAASLSLERNPRRPVPAAPDAASPAEGVAGQIQARARRLKDRIAAAPLPQRPSRNPFLFQSAPVAEMPRARRAEVARVQPAAIEETGLIEPVLVLIGMAEQRTTDGVVRTAMITSDGVEVIMAVVGTPVLGRYKVTAISAQEVELADASTGRTRRLALQER